MSEASSEFRPRIEVPIAPRRRRASGARARYADRRTPAVDPPLVGEPYPLDPPLPDVRIPVREPHATATSYSRDALMHRFPGVQVGDDLHMRFSEPGKVGQSVLAPDVFVALRVPRHGTRLHYDADRLGPPDFVLEVLSESTWKHDLGRKLDCYQQIGVRECLLFDVTGEDWARVGKALWGYALTPDGREPLVEKALPNGERGVVSVVLGLVAYVAERDPPSAPGEAWALKMRWHDPATGLDIPDYDQSREGEERAVAKAQAESTRADAAQSEAQAQRTRADAAQREAQAQRTRADAAQSEAQAQRTRADAESARADAALSETEAARRRIAELEAHIRRPSEGR